MRTLLQDLQYGARMLAKNPGFTAVAVITLALGIGASTAIFSVFHAVLLRPLPYRDSERLAILWTHNIRQNLPDGTSYPNFRDWKDQNVSFEDLAIFIRPTAGFRTLLGGDEPERVEARAVSWNFFPILGATAAIGRTFSAEEEARRETVAVISHGFWQRRFGASPDAVGRTVELQDRWARTDADARRVLRIVGVMPAHFDFPSRTTQIWFPVTQHGEDRDADSFGVLGKLKSGTTHSRAQADMTAIAGRLEKHFPDTNTGLGVTVTLLLTEITGEQTRLALSVLFGAVIFLLLIACANVASLLLERSHQRSRELAVRLAVGAGRWRLFRQMMTESFVLSLLGGGLGLLAVSLTIDALRHFGAGMIPRLAEAQIDSRILVFSLAVSVAACVIFGAGPAWAASRREPLDSMRAATGSDSRTPRAARAGNFLVAIECALAIVLLCGVGLLVRSLRAIQRVDAGFDADRLLVVPVELPRSRYGEGRGEVFYQQLLERIRSLPDVEAAGAVGRMFLEHNPDHRIVVEGQAPPSPGDPVAPLTSNEVTTGGLETLGVRLRRGRFFRDQDRAGTAAVAIINEAMARRFWPAQDPLGKRFRHGAATWLTVIGIVGDTHRQALEKEPIPEYFVPRSTAGDVVVRARVADPMLLAPAILAEIRALDKNLPPPAVTTAERRFEGFESARRFYTLLLTAFSAIALLLAATGIFGLLHYTVARRTQEIGIRMALGARGRDVMALVLRQSLSPALIGMAAGMLGALALTQAMRGLLFQVSPIDPVSYLIAAFVLAVSAFAASSIPARRAARVDPMVALRCE